MCRWIEISLWLWYDFGYDVAIQPFRDDLPLSESSVGVDGFISPFSQAEGMAFFPFWLSSMAARATAEGWVALVLRARNEQIGQKEY